MQRIMIRPFSLPPNPSLVGVILIIRTRSGPRLVFHYPGVPETTQRSTSWHFGSAGSDDDESGTSSSDEQTVASDNESTASSKLTARPSLQHPRTSNLAQSVSSSRRTARTLREDAPDTDEDDDHADNLDVDQLDLNSPTLDKPNPTASGAGHDRSSRNDPSDADKGSAAEWDRLLGYPAEGLEMMLSPPDSMHKKRFEVMLDNLVFLGYPVFVRPDGAWRKPRARKKHAGAEGGGGGDGDGDGDSDSDDDRENERHDARPLSPPVSPLTVRPRQSARSPEVARSFGSQGALSEAASEAESANSNQDDMTMFHVVFVMNPPVLEYHIRMQEMYDNVVKKFSKALRYEQARSGAVSLEAKRMQQMKAQAKESKTPMAVLWPAILSQSLLAKAMATVYTNIANSKIAHVSIGPSFDASIQIPQAVSTPYVPTPTEPQLPGLWLTTSTMLSDDALSLSPHAALLLLEDKDALLKDIEGDGKHLASPLAFFIRQLTPTKSLTKLSAALSLPLGDVQFLARHLIYWRRARATPPLHIRDTYIVSPNCDMRQLDKATPLYSQRFSALPSLPKMLQNLSSRPIQYGYLIPSKDHKPAYMEILAWMLRGGWVTQLRTFAWVRVKPEVKAAVAMRVRRDFEEKARRNPTVLSKGSTSSGDTRRRSADDESAGEPGPSRASSITSPHVSALLSPAHATSDAGSVSSTRTAIPVHASTALPSPNIGPTRPRDVETNAPSTPSVLSTGSATEHDEADTVVSIPALPPIEPAAYEQSLVLSPHKASTEESRWLAHIGANLDDQELRESWDMLHKHFDGRRALEEIAAREGMKRSKVQSLLNRLEHEGVLYIVRHW